MSEKSCLKCRFLVKYQAENGHWMNVCEAEDAEPKEEDGLYSVTTVVTDEFDASFCLLFKEQP